MMLLKTMGDPKDQGRVEDLDRFFFFFFLEGGALLECLVRNK